MKWKTVRLSVLLGVLGGLVLVRTGVWIPNAPARGEFPVRGIDVSHHNGAVDWPEVASEGYQFVFIKATEGADVKDPRFGENWAGAGAAGLVRGAYHFFSTLSSGEAQAKNFIATVPKSAGMLPPVIDVEFAREESMMSDAEFHLNFRILFERLHRHYGLVPIIYTTEEFHRNYLAEIRIERLWARAVVWKPYDAAGDWLFWQYSSKGRVRGIRTPTDLNAFRFGRPELAALQVGDD